MESPESRESDPALVRALLGAALPPVGLGAVLMALDLGISLLSVSAAVARVAHQSVAILLVATVAWLVLRLGRVARDAVRRHFRTDVPDNLRARKVHTQIEIAWKILVVAVWFVAFALALTTFEPLRRVGTGLLASAGVAGIILGLAAQKTLGNLIAGFQLAITQPIRLDDAVVVEGEWGWIEEITLTYVVLRIWDLRRLILPITYFTENPFQNWTRTSASILGTVFLRVDYTTPIEEVRGELERIVEASPHWSGEVWRLHVTEAGERTVELRALMSADDSPTAWELRCEVREKLLGWLQREHPGALPRVRAEVGGEPDRSAA